MIIFWVIRAAFIMMIIAAGLFGIRSLSGLEQSGTDEGLSGDLNTVYWLSVLSCFLIVIIGLTVDLLVPRKRISALAGVFFGIVVGVLIGLAFGYVVEMIYETYNITENSYPALYNYKILIKILINVLCCYWAVTFVMQTKDDFRFIIPYVEFSKQTRGTNPLLLDTSVIIDGRIADITLTGVFNSQLVVPRFILNELQLIADSSDRLKRNRGRRGLDILNKMQLDDHIDIVIKDIELTTREQKEPVDHKLVAAAAILNGRIVTNDFNLNKVCTLRKIPVININDLASSLKAVVLPGEQMQIKIVKQGDQPGQGVGYLDDGTMVVVDEGRHHLGKTVDITVTSALQTAAGRMIFGKIGSDRNDAEK